MDFKGYRRKCRKARPRNLEEIMEAQTRQPLWRKK
jgi:hypothetical protein